MSWHRMNLRRELLGALPFVVMLLPSVARAEAGLGACGDIFVEAGAECTIYVGPVCEGLCEPVRLTAACAAELRAECAGGCEASADVQCQAGCEADCRVDCEVDPGEFNCLASCQADCSGGCEGRCEAEPGAAECVAACEATCSGECSGRCEVTPPEVDCDSKCEAACTGSCEAQASLDCQIDCQAQGFAECRADLVGGCKIRCNEPEGALFCDGQFIDVRASVEDCVAVLRGLLEVEVMVHAEGEAACVGNTCRAEGEVGCSCGVDGGRAGLLALACVGLVGRRRRRARK